MTRDQIKRFDKLAKQMGQLLSEINETSPNVCLFLEDGLAALYDWPTDLDTRPDEAVSDMHIWVGSGGGGR